MKRPNRAERIAQSVSVWAGSSLAFVLATSVILVWLVSGPFFGFSDTWQLVINTSTTIVTFLMVFLIQRTQNKEILALQLKLNEIVAAVNGASNRLISIEDLSEEEVLTLHAHYQKLAVLAKNDNKITQSHSVEEAENRHLRKQKPSRVRIRKKRPAKNAPA